MAQELATSPTQSLALSEAAARTLTDEVKADAAALWAKLLHLYEGGAHTALGYSSWGDYCGAEFEMSDASAYRLLQAARVVAQLPIGSSRPKSESVARELTPLAAAPEQVTEAWTEAVEEHGPEPTAAQVREVVDRKVPKRKVKEQEQLIRSVMGDVKLLLHPASQIDLELMTTTIAQGERDEWQRQLRSLRTALSRLIDALA